MIIREYKLEDREAVEKLIAQFHESEKVFTPHFWVNEDISKPYFDYLVKKIEEGNGKIFVAEDNGAAVGYMAVRIEEEDSPRGAIKKNGYISNIVILKDYQGKGFGEALLKKAEEFTKDSGAKHIALDVQVGNKALDFYHKHGYQERSMWLDKKLDE
jgi:ribosomal protein S18 acetylase RimI-like enzyme